MRNLSHLIPCWEGGRVLYHAGNTDTLPNTSYDLWEVRTLNFFDKGASAVGKIHTPYQQIKDHATFVPPCCKFKFFFYFSFVALAKGDAVFIDGKVGLNTVFGTSKPKNTTTKIWLVYLTASLAVDILIFCCIIWLTEHACRLTIVCPPFWHLIAAFYWCEVCISNWI